VASNRKIAYGDATKYAELRIRKTWAIADGSTQRVDEFYINDLKSYVALLNARPEWE
jgi:hypothetical protein